MTNQDTTQVRHYGGCHCGDVKFEIKTTPNVRLIDCNCSMCDKLGYQHLIVENHRFKLLTPEDNLECYTFNTGVAKHYFCKRCGIKSFYVPRSHPDKYSVNLRCIENSTLHVEKVVKFDGQNWEQARENLK